MFKATIRRRRRSCVTGLILIGALVGLFQFTTLAGQSVTLTWENRGSADVVGYKIYSGTTSRAYDQVLVVGNTTTAIIPGLDENTTYYFVATALDGAGNESDFSNETTVMVTATNPSLAATLTSATLANGQFGFAVAGVVGRIYVIQASTDLINWIAVQTNASPFTFVDADTASHSQRFYRTFSPAP